MPSVIFLAELFGPLERRTSKNNKMPSMKPLSRAVAILSVAVLLAAAEREACALDPSAAMTKCWACHGKDGSSANPDIPVIGGMSSAYIEANLAAYQNKDRPCPKVEIQSGDQKGRKSDMCEAVKGFSAADIKQLADDLAGRKFVAPAQTVDGALAAKGQSVYQQSCHKCHSQDGRAADDDSGILAGQWIPYMKAQIEAVQSGARKTDKKNKMKKTLDDLDSALIDAALAYFASKR